MSRLKHAIVALAVAVVLGLLGASAFNPQSGFLLDSEVLWRVCGITSEVGLPTLLLLAILATIATVVSRPGASRPN